MHNSLLRNLSLNELLHEMHHSQDVMLRNLENHLSDLYELYDNIVNYDIDMTLVVKDYKNFDMKLNDFLESEYWQQWDESNRNNLPFHYDGHDRARRIEEAAEYGGEGSTHGEVIDDWIKCLEEREADLEFGPFTVQRLMMEAEHIQEWFEKEGRLNELVC